MKPFKALTVGFLMAMPITAKPAKRSCDSGTYQCLNPAANATSTVQVCAGGSWLLAAVCGAGQKCVQDDAGGCACQAY
ncbi:hypothetical protein F4861DRAFT_50078 [Xylaria intraflava]|nr:hypothetical protein F4861DRAFT_50078 [Xylaria intraflava]